MTARPCSALVAVVFLGTIADARSAGPCPVVCSGHEAFVVSVAVSPDGKVVASGADDQTLRLWDAASGKAIAVVRPIDPPMQGGWNGGLAFSPDGRTLAAALSAVPLRLYVLGPRGKPAPGGGPLKDGGHGIAFSPDGKHFAAARQSSVDVWDTASGDKVRTFTFDRTIGRAWRVAFSPDGKYLAAALHRYGGREMEAPRARVWSLETGKEVFAGWDTGGHVNAVAFSPDGKLLVVGGENEQVELYDWGASKRTRTFKVDRHGLFCLAFSADGKQLYTGGTEPEVKCWDVATGKLLGKLEGNTDQVADLALSRDGKVLATAGRDRRVRIWRLGE